MNDSMEKTMMVLKSKYKQLAVKTVVGAATFAVLGGASSYLAAGPTVSPSNFVLLRDKTPFSITIYSSGDNPRYLSAGDLNGDGFVDFAVPSDPDGTPVQSTLGVHLSDGNGGYTLSTVNVVADSQHTHIADINKDTNNDIIVGHRSHGSYAFSILLGNGSGGFQPATPYQINGSTADARNIIAGDFDGDTDMDLAIGTETGGGQVSILINNGSLVFTESQVIGLDGEPTGLDLADVDGDTDKDLLVTAFVGTGPGGVKVLKNNPGGPTFFDSEVSYTVHSFPYDGQFIDSNGDTILDIVVGGAGIGGDNLGSGDTTPVDNVTFLPGDGAGAFNEASKVVTQTMAFKSRGFVAGDFNGDGATDIATASPGKTGWPPQLGQDIRVLYGDNSGKFNTETMLVYDDYWDARGIVAEDVDNDGDLDIIFAFGGGNSYTGNRDSIGVMENRKIR